MSRQTEFPQLLVQLMTNTHSKSKNFFENIRAYNGSLATASISSNLQVFNRPGPYVYKVCGQIYHYIGPVQPREGELPIFNQLYFLDTAEAMNSRSQNIVQKKLDFGLLSDLENLLREVNPFVGAYRMMKEVTNMEENQARLEHREVRNVRLVFDLGTNQDLRRYNLPRCNEVAAVVIGDTSEGFRVQDLVVHMRTGEKRRIPTINASCDPMAYPLLFPCGETGWMPGLISSTGNKICINAAIFFGNDINSKTIQSHSLCKTVVSTILRRLLCQG